MHSWREQFKDSSASTFLFLLLLADCAFISLHVILLIILSLNIRMFSLSADHGWPEFFQYTKELWIIALLLLVCIKARTVGFAVWAILFIYLFLDDSFLLHERYGNYIARSLKFSSFAGLRPQDYGELIISGIVAASFLILLSLFYIRGSDAFRCATRHLLSLLVALAFFGIFVDMLHVALYANRNIEYLLLVVEDGGEMVVMSFITWYVFLLNVRAGVAYPSERHQSLS